MNKNCYRIVFNASRGQRMAVAETVASQGKITAGQTRSGFMSSFTGSLVTTLRPASFAVSAALGLVLWMQPQARAQIVADPGAPRSQQPTVLAAPNGVPVVNIQTPSTAGVSRNTYHQFDVNQPSAILNNSRANVQTQTGGWVQGNPWLATGSARIILNEVNSSNASQLRGYVEVAGQRAEVVIANPAGIHVDGGGFINTSRVLLTTGTPLMNGGNLDGYRVQGGSVSVGGLGLDASTADYTAILARAVQVNAGIWARELKLTTGANQVDAGQTNVTPMTGTGTAPAFALDASALGGMYAGKITLIGTEAGVGVRNAGVIGATAGDVVVQSNGWLTNNGTIQAASQARINTAGAISSGGSIYAGGDLSITATGAVTLNGQTLIAGNASVSGMRVSLVEGKVTAQNSNLTASTGDIDASRASIGIQGTLNASTAQTLRTDGATISAGQINFAAHDASNIGGEIEQAGTQTTRISVSGTLDNTGGKIESNGDTTLSAQSLLNQGGRIQATGAANLEVTATATLDNSAGGYIIAGGNNGLHAGSLNNNQGQVTAGGGLGASADAGLSNVQGLIAANGAVHLASASLDNTHGTVASLQTELAVITSGALNNDGGLIHAAGALTIDTSGATLANTHAASHASGAGGITSQGTLTLATGNLNNAAGFIGAKGALSATTANVTNSAGGQVVGESSIAISSTGFDNRGGQVQALGDVSLHAGVGSIDNSASLIRSAGITTLSANAVRNGNTSGASQGIEGNDVAIMAAVIANDHGAIRADNNAALTSSGSLDNSAGLISAGNTLAVQDSAITKTLAVGNTGGTVIAGQSASIDAASLTGDGKVLSRGDLTLALTSDFDNSAEVTANHNASISTAGNLANSGKLQAGETLRVSASSIDNATSGEITGASTQFTAANTLTNRGLIDGQDTQLNAATLNNLGTGRIYGDYLGIQAGSVNNDVEGGSAATIAARQRLDIGAGTVNNREGALIFSAGDMAIGGGLDANRQATGQAAAVNNASATIEALGNLGMNAAQINNTNNHFSTEQRFVSSQSVVEYSPTGSPNHYTESQVRLYYPDENIHLISPEGDAYDFNRFSYVRTVTETAPATSDPGQLLAGGNLTLNTQGLLNDKSHIIAGAALNVFGATAQNTTVPGTRQTRDNGVATHYYVIFRSGPDGQGADDSPYAPPATLDGITLRPTRYDRFTTPVGTGTALTDAALGSVSATTGAAGAVNASVRSGSIIQVNASVGSVAPTSGGAQVVRAMQVNTGIPNTSLFHVNSNPAGSYLMETDPRFASYRQWLSSDYLLQALNIDPAATQKRLGDGFYEQRLVREQVAQLTGQRFLGDYRSDEEQYRALMQAGTTYARQWNLRPGIALSEAQMAQLTSDIVWLVEQPVMLAGGQVTSVLVPQVYVRVQDGDLDGSGALLAGREINLKLSGDLTNAGTIAGRNIVNLTAQNIQNLGGRIQSDAVSVTARTDLNNIGGTIQAASALNATAGRDLNVVTTTRTASSAVGGNSFSRTRIDRVAGLYVTGLPSGQGGTLVVSAGRDANIIAGVISNGPSGSANSPSTSSGQAPGGATTVVAGNNLNLGTVTTASANQIVWDAKNRRSDGASTEVGSQIQSAGTVRLAAGNDLNAKSANIEAASALLASAGRDLNISAGQGSQSVDEAHQHTNRGFLSSRTDTTLDQVERTASVGSSLGGSTVTAVAGRDLTVTGSSVVSDRGTTLAAGSNITIEAVSSTSEEQHLVAQKKSGLLGSGGIGFTIGTREQSTDGQGQGTSHSASTVGAIDGDVNITAGNLYQQKGSDLVAPSGDVNVLARNIAITEVHNTSNSQSEQKFKQSGLTLAVSSPVLSALQTGQQMMQAAGNTSDGRMQALAGASGALAGRNAYNAIQAGQGSSMGGKEGQIATGRANADGTPETRDANAADKAGGVNVSISIGSSKSQGNSSQRSDMARGSSVTAGGNVNLTATGAGQDSNLTVRGSEIKAGGNVALSADNQINLLAAQNTSEQRSSNKSSSGSIGVSLGTGGFGVTASASKGRGNADGSDQAWTNSHVEAGNTLSIQSGGDTSLKGAVVKAKTVKADVGGNLAIASLQDSSSYASKNQSMGGSLTVGAGASGSASFSKSKTNSDFASVAEQSGIKAGDGGFQVNVTGNTDLKGAVIASTDKAAQEGKNMLTTATLTHSDIQNRAEASASSGIDLSSDMLTQGKYGAAKALVGSALNNGKASGSSAGVSRSAISAGPVTITNEAAQQALTGQGAETTLAGLNRDTANAHAGAQRQDMQAMAQTAEAERAIKQEAFKQGTAVTTDLVYKAATADKKIILQRCDMGGQNCKQERVDSTDVKVVDGKVYVFNHGIMNTEGQALEAAAKQSSDTANAQGVHVIINPYTGNPVAEVLYATWDKLNEITGAALPITNASQANINLRERVKAQGGKVIEVDHSRGSLTSSNATAAQIDRDTTDAAIDTVTFNGAAANAQRMADRVNQVTNGRGTVLQSTHKNDQVGTVLGGNASTGGNTVNVFDAHRSYTGNLPPVLNADGEPNTVRALTDEAWGKGKISTPVLVRPSDRAGAMQ